MLKHGNWERERSKDVVRWCLSDYTVGWFFQQQHADGSREFFRAENTNQVSKEAVFWMNTGKIQKLQKRRTCYAYDEEYGLLHQW